MSAIFRGSSRSRRPIRFITYPKPTPRCASADLVDSTTLTRTGGLERGAGQQPSGAVAQSPAYGRESQNRRMAVHSGDLRPPPTGVVGVAPLGPGLISAAGAAGRASANAVARAEACFAERIGSIGSAHRSDVICSEPRWNSAPSGRLMFSSKKRPRVREVMRRMISPVGELMGGHRGDSLGRGPDVDQSVRTPGPRSRGIGPPPVQVGHSVDEHRVGGTGLSALREVAQKPLTNGFEAEGDEALDLRPLAVFLHCSSGLSRPRPRVRPADVGVIPQDSDRARRTSGLRDDGRGAAEPESAPIDCADRAVAAHVPFSGNPE